MEKKLTNYINHRVIYEWHFNILATHEIIKSVSKRNTMQIRVDKSSNRQRLQQQPIEKSKAIKKIA